MNYGKVASTDRSTERVGEETASLLGFHFSMNSKNSPFYRPHLDLKTFAKLDQALSLSLSLCVCLECNLDRKVI